MTFTKKDSEKIKSSLKNLDDYLKKLDKEKKKEFLVKIDKFSKDLGKQNTKFFKSVIKGLQDYKKKSKKKAPKANKMKQNGGAQQMQMLRRRPNAAASIRRQQHERAMRRELLGVPGVDDRVRNTEDMLNQLVDAVNRIEEINRSQNGALSNITGITERIETTVDINRHSIGAMHRDLKDGFNDLKSVFNNQIKECSFEEFNVLYGLFGLITALGISYTFDMDGMMYIAGAGFISGGLNRNLVVCLKIFLIFISGMLKLLFRVYVDLNRHIFTLVSSFLGLTPYIGSILVIGWVVIQTCINIVIITTLLKTLGLYEIIMPYIKSTLNYIGILLGKFVMFLYDSIKKSEYSIFQEPLELIDQLISDEIVKNLGGNIEDIKPGGRLSFLIFALVENIMKLSGKWVACPVLCLVNTSYGNLGTGIGCNCSENILVPTAPPMMPPTMAPTGEPTRWGFWGGSPRIKGGYVITRKRPTHPNPVKPTKAKSPSRTVKSKSPSRTVKSPSRTVKSPSRTVKSKSPSRTIKSKSPVNKLDKKQLEKSIKFFKNNIFIKYLPKTKEDKELLITILNVEPASKDADLKKTLKEVKEHYDSIFKFTVGLLTLADVAKTISKNIK